MTENEKEVPVPGKVPDEWDFYLTRLDDAGASFFLNFWFRKRAPLPGVDTLYRCDLEMIDPGPHGLGEEADAEALQVLEEKILDRAGEHGLYFVGRIRWKGSWLLRFFGPPGQCSELETATRTAMEGGTNRRFTVDSTEDSEWSHYVDFLFPDDDRWQWIQDRHSVEDLLQHGDKLELPRRVDHWIFFDTAKQRNAFLREAVELDYGVEPSHGKSDDGKYCAQVHRVSAVELEEIHDVVMSLIELADAHDGEYDGWETTVETGL